MFRDLLSSRALHVGFVLFVLIVGGTQLYSWHVRRGIKADEARTQQFLQQREIKKETRTAQDAGVPTDTETLGETEMPLETDGRQPISDDTAALPRDAASDIDEVADAFLPDDVVLEAESTEVPVSPFGFGPYPEVPEGWPADTFPAPSADHELMTRVRIKLLSQGIDVTGSTMENGLIYPTIKGIAYVKWKEYEPPTGTVRYISEILATGADGKRLHAIRREKGKSLTSEDIPADIKLVPFEEGGIDAYVFLNLP